MTRAREVSIAQPVRPKDRGSVLSLLNFFLQHPLLVFGVPLLFGLVAAIFSLVRSPSYTAESKFATQKGASSNARFAGLAAQFGVSLESSNPGESLDFYMELLTSQHLLRDAAATNYSFRDPETNRVITGNLAQLYGIKRASPDAALRDAALRLRSNISLFPNVRSGLITLRTGAEWGGLAVAVNQRLLELVNGFNLQTRQAQASHERQFVDERLNVAQDELTAAENALKQFNQDNRGFAGSPQLQFEQQRLQRRVDLRQQVYVSLAQAYEQARIDEVRNTPVITIVEPPFGTATRRGGGVITNALLGIFAGLVVGIILALGREYFRREAAEDPQAAAELRGKVAFWRRRLRPSSRTAARVEASHRAAHEEG